MSVAWRTKAQHGVIKRQSSIPTSIFLNRGTLLMALKFITLGSSQTPGSSSSDVDSAISARSGHSVAYMNPDHLGSLHVWIKSAKGLASSNTKHAISDGSPRLVSSFIKM
ncbi:unnamed protein product [Protopolystoma xenopodis]|uniref:Uncharacterized protein n=1 Tax=Protopolystoma xenopodis TaxID=117903 RepID=A0A448WB19_9PLAT|nr:unnamed protein product [Protopolystoma xenopodis]